MIDPDDLRAIYQAAVSAQAAIGILADRIEATLPQPRQQVGARVTATVYRQLKAKAALQGVAVGTLVEQAISEFLERTAGPNGEVA